MILGSLGLLLLTCIESSLVRDLTVIAWLSSLVLVGLRNVGAVLGIYVAAVALYSGHHSGGQISVFERPDHAALLVLLAEMGLMRMRNKRWFSIDWLTLTLCTFLVYGLINGVLTGTFAAWKVAQFSRTFGIPLVLAIVALRAKPKIREVQSFFMVVLIVAGYSALVSVLWVSGVRDLIFPGWINDPGVNRWATGSRGVGLLMQPGSSGKLVSLVFCMVVLVYRRWIKGYGRLLLIFLGAALLAGVFLSYSRAVYLGMIPAVLILFWEGRGGRSTALKRYLLIGTAAIGISFALLTPTETLDTRVSNEATVVWRFEIWKIGLRMVPERPLFGYGIRGYGEHAAEYLQDSHILTRQRLEAHQPAVHNTFLNLIIEFGLVGFFLYVASMYFLFKRAVLSGLKLWGREGAIWVLVFLIVYFIPSQFSVIQDPTVNLIFYCTPALLAGLVKRPYLQSGQSRKAEAALPSSQMAPVRKFEATR